MLIPKSFIEDLLKRAINKKILVYGAGTYGDYFFKTYGTYGFNIVGVVDIKYADQNGVKFYDVPAFSPEKIGNLDYDILLVLLREPKYISDIIESAGKAGKEVIMLSEYHKNPFCEYNKIIVVEDGKERCVTEQDLPQGFNIVSTDDCKNNTVKIGLPQKGSRVVINFKNVSDCTFEIESTQYYVENLFVYFAESTFMKIKIGKDISVVSASILTNQTNSTIEIGEDCMLAKNVKIVGSDGHQIFDMNTGELINAYTGKCQIGNHVWLGDESRIMKRAKIADNSVVGANSVVSREFDEPNVIIAGNPAKIVRRNIMWKRDVITTLADGN